MKRDVVKLAHEDRDGTEREDLRNASLSMEKHLNYSFVFIYLIMNNLV